jgi:hypothetical protein
LQRGQIDRPFRLNPFSIRYSQAFIKLPQIEPNINNSIVIFVKLYCHGPVTVDITVEQFKSRVLMVYELPSATKDAVTPPLALQEVPVVLMVPYPTKTPVPVVRVIALVAVVGVVGYLWFRT